MRHSFLKRVKRVRRISMEWKKMTRNEIFLEGVGSNNKKLVFSLYV